MQNLQMILSGFDPAFAMPKLKATDTWHNVLSAKKLPSHVAASQGQAKPENASPNNTALSDIAPSSGLPDALMGGVHGSSPSLVSADSIASQNSSTVSSPVESYSEGGGGDNGDFSVVVVNELAGTADVAVNQFRLPHMLATGKGVPELGVELREELERFAEWCKGMGGCGCGCGCVAVWPARAHTQTA